MLKALNEKRNALLDKADELVKKIEAETRAFDETEQKEYDGILTEISSIDKTIKSIVEARAIEKREIKDENEPESKEALEERAFVNCIKGVPEARADVNLTVNNGKVTIPSTIVNKIIEQVVEICPIFRLSTLYNMGGTISIPYYDESTTAFTMDYAEEFVELVSTSGKYIDINLTGYLAGGLTKISKSLINNSQFDILSHTIKVLAERIARWIEKQLLLGKDGKIEGLRGVKKSINAASATSITTDNLIDVQEEIPDVYQSNAIWIMSKKTRTALRKLKDSEGNYILNRDVTGKWSYILLGKPVYVSDNMPNVGAGNTSVFYGDFSGLAVKISEGIEIQVTQEQFATQHAVGVYAWLEMDAKVEDAQKIAKLVHA